MKCPYCNKFLKQVNTTAYCHCYWCGCDKTEDMFGTLAMWKKVESLQKIRKCTYRYHKENKEKRNAYMREYYARKKTEKKDK